MNTDSTTGTTNPKEITMNTSPVTTTGRVAPIDEFFLTDTTDDTTTVPTAAQWAELDARVTRLSAEFARAAHHTDEFARTARLAAESAR